MLSAIFELTAGEGLISSLFRRTAAINEAAIKMALFTFFPSLLPLLPAFCSRQLLLGQGAPLKTSLGLYRNAVQQHEQLTLTESLGGGSDLSGWECSSCGSIARQLIVQLHFLHLTTQADGNLELTPNIAQIIGE